jgi:hypothetical protein
MTLLGDVELEEKLLAPCGAYCGTCEYYLKERTPNCPGCGMVKGRPFWGECKLYACSTDHKVEHCGLCRDFPCNLFIDQFDPEHGQESAFTRAGLLVYRKKVGTELYIEIVKKLKQKETSSHQ